MLRVGLGYDIHRSTRGRGLRLGGVSFPRAGFSLAGHSDADVIVHAACDALLGAAGLPDIGVLFPNTSPRNRGRDSLEFLAEVRRRLARLGLVTLNLDCTLVAEAPRISGHVPRMRRRLAKVLGLRPGQVNIKATTNEGVGFIGRGEGVAALAVALVETAPKKPMRGLKKSV